MFQVNPELTYCFEEKGLKFVGHDTEGSRMEIIELESERLTFFVILIASIETV